MTIFKRLKTQKPKMNDCRWLSEVEKLQITAANFGIVNEGITESWHSSCDDREDSHRLRHPLRCGNRARVPCPRRKSPNPTSAQNHLCRQPVGNSLEAGDAECQRVLTKSSPEYLRDQGEHQAIKVNPLSLNSCRTSSVTHASARRFALLSINDIAHSRLLSFPLIYHPAFLAVVLPVTTVTPPKLLKSPRSGGLESTSTNFGYSSSDRRFASDGWTSCVVFFTEPGYTIEFGPGDYRKGESMGQRRGDVNRRKAISNVCIFLKSYVMPLNENPFHEFEDGWGIRFTVNDQIVRRQVKTIEEDEVADRPDENSPFIYQDDTGQA